MGGNSFNFQDHDGEEEEEAERALSLSDLPLDDPPASSDETPSDDFSDPHARWSSSHPQDLFEFFSCDFSFDDHVMCPADDIIICGKLVPFKGPYGSPNPTCSHPFAEAFQEEEQQQQQQGTKVQNNASSSGLRNRSESSSNSGSSKTKLKRKGRSLDYQKLQRFSSSISYSPETKVNTNSSLKSFSKAANVLARRAARPRWSVFMFGMVKFPAEMELEDIKTRQLRQNPTTLFVPTEAAVSASARARGNLSVSRSKGSWRLLNALSCKDHSNVAIVKTTPFASFPRGKSFA